MTAYLHKAKETDEARKNLHRSAQNGLKAPAKLKDSPSLTDGLHEALNFYLRDLSRYDLLSSEEEISLARKVEAWRTLKRILSSHPVPEPGTDDVDNMTDEPNPVSIGDYVVTELASLQDSCDKFASILSSSTNSVTLSTLCFNEDFKDALDHPRSGDTFRKFAELLKCEYEAVLTTVEKISSNSRLVPDKVIEILGTETPVRDLLKRWKATKASYNMEKLRTIFQNHFEKISSAGVESRDYMCESNLRLVVSIAKRYKGRGLSLGDLIQEGNIGLLRSIEKYNYRLGYKFSTYATWWVKQSVARAINTQARDMRIPVMMEETVTKVQMTRLKFIQEYGREPTFEEYLAELQLPAWRINEAMKLLKENISLDAPRGERSYSAMKDSIQDNTIPPPESEVEKISLTRDLRSVIATLTPKEQEVIKSRYGIDSGREKTLQEIGIDMGLTRERIRQIESSALKKLLHPTRSKKLRDYIY